MQGVEYGSHLPSVTANVSGDALIEDAPIVIPQRSLQFAFSVSDLTYLSDDLLRRLIITSVMSLRPMRVLGPVHSWVLQRNSYSPSINVPLSIGWIETRGSPLMRLNHPLRRSAFRRIAR